MKYFRRFILYLVIVVTHFLLQSTMMLISIISKFIFYDDTLWSVGGLLSVISNALYHVLAFPFVWVFQQFSITFTWFEDLPFVLNSLLWGWLVFVLIVQRAKHRHGTSRYQFVRGVAK